jgi:hypothetical protein
MSRNSRPLAESDTENIGPQVVSGDDAVGRVLDGRPPIAVEQALVAEPVGNGLLTDGRVDAAGTEVVPHALGELRLPAGDLDGATEGGNVLLLHSGRRKYTRILVDVNKQDCFTANNEACKVVPMVPLAKKKPAGRSSSGKGARKTAPEVGPDGMTFPQRLYSVMNERGIGQTELARRCSEYYATFAPRMEDRVKQQHIFNALGGQSSSEFLPLIAAVLDVRELWLQFGIGPRERGAR